MTETRETYDLLFLDRQASKTEGTVDRTLEEVLELLANKYKLEQKALDAVASDIAKQGFHVGRARDYYMEVAPRKEQQNEKE